ncbi:hypothetical protein [Qipengyuania sp.]|uniref:hypothetical protein n=1 Tax=Qipengyuania sp. TaxID=2004515 RepID=UPI0035C7C89B
MPNQTFDAATKARANGWTPERRDRFLASLASGLSITAACASVGLSREAAYKARRRDLDFAQRWADAQTSASHAAGQAFLDSLPETLRTRLAQNVISS